ncbi:MAG TPA: sigma 54-interacting transcriptional regulator [Terriglobales bacterium]|nr:sigma 54-interacting transcriptional regulator [Terriglobales bacterium]
MSASPSQYQVHGFEAVVVSEPMRKLMQMVERVARASASVLITGETGSGKEFIARALHHHSLRCTKPWIDLNCAALPEHLVESELFGYEKGAFSGADSMKIGLFELANGGTLFLDEIGELEPKVQVKLLRVLDGVPYYRLGGNKKVSVDVRIIAATNQNLEAAVKTGRFRSDLYHRLGQVQLRIPPLRERPEDIEALAEFFLQQNSPGVHFSPEAMVVLKRFPWTGNVRELRNIVIQACMVAEGTQVKLTDLPSEVAFGTSATEAAPITPAQPTIAVATAVSNVTDLDQIEKQTILRTLAQTGGHQGLAAEQLGISRRTLSRKLKQYNLRADREAAAGPLGFLNREQQQYFRAAIELPVTICTSRGVEIHARTINVSSGGLCVSGVDNPLQCSGILDIRFPLPDSDVMVEAKAQVAWADVQKKAGLRFVDFPPEHQHTLDRWLHARQHEEGWTVQVG